MNMASHVSEHQAIELARCAQAMYANERNAVGHMLSAIAARYWGKDAFDLNDIRRIDEAMKIYRAWLCFNEYPEIDHMERTSFAAQIQGGY